MHKTHSKPADGAWPWIPITDEQPKEHEPVIAGWNKSPWHVDGRPLVSKNALCVQQYGNGIDWYDELSGDSMEWDEEQRPTHWMHWPSPPTVG